MPISHLRNANQLPVFYSQVAVVVCCYCDLVYKAILTFLNQVFSGFKSVVGLCSKVSIKHNINIWNLVVSPQPSLAQVACPSFLILSNKGRNEKKLWVVKYNPQFFEWGVFHRGYYHNETWTATYDQRKKYKFSDSGFLNVNIFWFLFNYSKPNIFGSWRQQDISGGPAGLWDTVINFFHLL